MSADESSERRPSVFIAKGHGWGHGVGLSQYGAYGMALDGASYKRILSRYYRDTRLDRGASREVRVLLTSGIGSVAFSGAGEACGKDIRTRKTYRFELGGHGVLLRSERGSKIKNCGRSAAARGAGPVTAAGIGAYHGKLVARDAGSGLNVINEVGLEHYIRGVIPNEMPSSWPQSALRAQAVAARSYALATGVDGDGFDLYDDTRSQVYGGVVTEADATNEAVRKTRREVLRHEGAVATTFFFSTSGGRTEAVEYGFPGASPAGYLKSVRDPGDELSPYHDWKARFSEEEIESRLSGLFKGNFRRIEVIERGDSPRIVKARVVGSNGSSVVSGPTLQARLELRSTWFRIEKKR